ncbi:MAG: NAD(P)H-hydrate dehydratase [Rhodocyclaceae bacterium]|nr:NAD(P)H-hydrate dehydratase [Rhodocyclaceae bacterium]
MAEPILLLERLRALESQYAHLSPPLMERAGEAAAQQVERLVGATKRMILVLAGPGNNGGDAFVMARHLLAKNYTPYVMFVGEPDRLPPDARRAYSAWRELGGECHARWPDCEPALIVDGLFGIGLSRPIVGIYAEWIENANASRSPMLALDVPSGLDAERGRTTGPAIVARHTLTFIAHKPGLLTGDGPDHCGEITLASLGVPVDHADGALVEPSLFSPHLRPRRRNTHKGDFGSAAIIGGATGMTGAALLAGRAALMLGAGRVYVGLLERQAVDSLQPELMLRQPFDALEHATVIAIGPGLGRTLSAHEPLLAAIDAPKPLILDADALFLVAESPLLARRLHARAAPTILTPHPGEAARLLDTTSALIQDNRLSAALELARRFRATVILKGCGSIIAVPEGHWYINASGHPGLATAGTGDVLTGMISALLAQGWPPLAASLAATHLHGLAAERLAHEGIGPIGLTAQELIPMARQIFNGWIDRFGC